MVIKTISLKLDRPTRAKREMIEDAFDRYSRAFQAIIDSLKTEMDTQQPLLPTKNAFLKLITKPILDSLVGFNVEPFKDSLKLDAAMTMAAYYGRMKAGKKTTFPVSSVDTDGLLGLIDELTLGDENNRAVKDQVRKAAAKLSQQRPVLFCRYSMTRDYCLLFDRKNNRYYAKLYLLNNRFALTDTGPPQRHHHELCYLAEEFPSYQKGKKSRYIIVPLSFGRWQEAYLKQALKNPAMLKSAQLIKAGCDYYLNVKLECAAQKTIASKTYLSVARSLSAPVSLCVCTNEGELKKPFSLSMPRGSPSFLHLLSNRIIQTAEENASQLILYHLQNRKDSIEYDGKRACLSAGEYTQLTKLLQYKADLAGLPAPVTVSPNGVFTACPVCGKNSLKNRRSEDIFICTSCGYSENLEQLGAKNLAVRLIRYSENKVVVDASEKGGRVIYENKPLDIRFSSPADENALSRFLAYFENHLAVCEPRDSKQASIMKKLRETANLSEMLYFRMK